MQIEFLKDCDIEECNDFHNRAYDAGSGQALPLVEMPIVFMEGALVEQYPAEAFERHLRHIAMVGGAVSLLFRPGQFHNPEHPETLGLYRRLLGCARRLGAVGERQGVLRSMS